jgi:hypothetical protein
VYPGHAHGTELLNGQGETSKSAADAKPISGGKEPIVPLVVHWLGAAFKDSRGL